MLDRIPKVIDYIRFTDARKSIKASLSIKFCQRILDTVLHINDIENQTIEIELDFGIDEFRHRFLKGTLKTDLYLQCQRCMEAMNYNVDIEFSLAFIETEYEEEKISGLYEPYFIETDDSIDLYALIEDEILLSLPLIAKHDTKDCHRVSIESDTMHQSNNDSKKSSPFEILKTLKQ